MARLIACSARSRFLSGVSHSFFSENFLEHISNLEKKADKIVKVVQIKESAVQ